jgi:hypothetical protein
MRTFLCKFDCTPSGLVTNNWMIRYVVYGKKPLEEPASKVQVEESNI